MQAPALVVAAIVVDRLAAPRWVLAARRRSPAASAGRWELPGGKVESGEDPVAALRRELAEELDIAVVVGAELRPPGAATWPVSPRYALRVWFVEVVGGDPRPLLDHDRIRWLSASTLGDVDWLPADRAVVDRLRLLLHRVVRG